MFRKIEIFAEKLVDYFDAKKNKKVIEKKTNKIVEENLDKIYYKIIPYHKNNFDNTVFLKLLKKFSSYSQRLNFYLT